MGTLGEKKLHYDYHLSDFFPKTNDPFHNFIRQFLAALKWLCDVYHCTKDNIHQK